jgi:hypothetical protein
MRESRPWSFEPFAHDEFVNDHGPKKRTPAGNGPDRRSKEATMSNHRILWPRIVVILRISVKVSVIRR